MSNKESAQCAMSKLTDVRSDAKDRINTGCSLNIVFFENFKIYFGLWPLFVFPRCVHFILGPLNDRKNTSAAAELAELRKITTF